MNIPRARTPFRLPVRWSDFADSAFVLLAPPLLVALAPIWVPYYARELWLGRRFARRAASAKPGTFDMTSGATVIVLEQGRQVAEVPVADITRIRWWNHVASSSFASGPEVDTLVELETRASTWRILLVDMGFRALTPLVERGLLSPEPANGGRAQAGCLGAMALPSLALWGLIVALLFSRFVLGHAP
ncbi:hypothetical protein [Chondromyces apiculatus]|uniref:Uncharacterized protein n=1 Tax=Chondromyces apiculatus DSM 436 TaxID=1192034 RepID=A0A017TAU1_9BACT|nr:hypothetical protein [Chondromyces apiculatus]EYF06403.1 Hypothetical protein CAP_1933 [Chondromyces apiculatus DSM 436]